MQQYDSNDVLFFFGAGASAPFGIPTMREFVINFEKELYYNADQTERELYSDIKKTLENRIYEVPDLEAIFSVIDGIISYDNPRKLGMLSLYFATNFKENFPNREHVETAKRLKEKFQAYVRENCTLEETSYERVATVFKDLFNRFALESSPSKANYEYAWNRNWSIFTTNYDVCLEYYWCSIAECGIDTNFDYDPFKKRSILSSKLILSENSEKMKLFKLHGSINWQIEAKTGQIIESMQKGKSIIGTKYVGELMLYPIAEKQLYLEPYISMFLKLNRELEKKDIWVVIGYSFNDPVIQDIFLNHCSINKHLILVHPKAQEIVNRKFAGAKVKISAINQKFGLIEGEIERDFKAYNHLNYQIMCNVLGAKPKISPQLDRSSTEPPAHFLS